MAYQLADFLMDHINFREWVWETIDDNAERIEFSAWFWFVEKKKEEK